MRCVVIFIPLSLHLLPIHDFSFGYGFCLAQLLISPFALGIALLHRLYSSFVKDVDYSTAYAVVQLFGAKGFALYVEVGDVEIKDCAESMAHQLLLVAVASHLAPEEFADNGYFAL